MSSFILILFLGLKTWAVGNFEGHWIATQGEVTSNLGLSSTCTKIEIVIRQTESSIVTDKYESTCQLYSSTWGPVVQRIQDGKVYEDEDVVGTIDDSSLLTTAPSGTVFYIYNLKLVPNNNGQMDLEAEYGVRNYLGTILTTARLVKQ